MHPSCRHLLSLPGQYMPLSGLMRCVDISFFLPLYHNISNSEIPWLAPFYYSNSTKQFEKDIDFMLEHFLPVSLETLHQVLSGREPAWPEKPMMHLSIDDGLKSCRETIAPILLKKGLPASFFVNPAFIGNQALFYRYKIGLTLNSRPNLPSAIRKQLMSMTYTDTPHIDQLMIKYGVDFNTRMQAEQPYMTESDLQWLSDQGFSLGAHSMDHPDFRLLNDKERKKQVSDSVNWIQNRFPQKVVAFSFPFTDYGMPADFIRWLSTKCDLSFGCAGLKTDIIPTHLQRLAMDKYPLNSAKKVFKSNLFLKILKSPFGRNKISR